MTGALDGYFSVTKTSKASASVKAGLITSVKPTIEGHPWEGKTLTTISES